MRIKNMGFPFINRDKQFSALVNGAITEIVPQDLQGALEIRKNCFANITNLRKVDLSSSLVTIGASAFSGCTNLQEVKLNDGLAVINEQAFYNCTKLTTLGNIPSTLISIGKNAFYNTPKLNVEFIQPENCVVANQAFVSSGFTKIVYGGALKEAISGYDITFCNAKWIELLDGTKTLGQSALVQAFLETVILPKTIESIGSNQFGTQTGNIYTLRKIVVKATTPPTLDSTGGFLKSFPQDKPGQENGENGYGYCYVPYKNSVIEDYKVAPNWAGGIDKLKPLVNSVEELSTIDITHYTIACINDGDKYPVMHYDDISESWKPEED